MGITSNSPSKMRKGFLNTKQLLAQMDQREDRFIAAPAQSQLTFPGFRAPDFPLTTSYKAPVPSERLQSCQAGVPSCSLTPARPSNSSVILVTSPSATVWVCHAVSSPYGHRRICGYASYEHLLHLTAPLSCG